MKQKSEEEKKMKRQIKNESRQQTSKTPHHIANDLFWFVAK